LNIYEQTLYPTNFVAVMQDGRSRLDENATRLEEPCTGITMKKMEICGIPFIPPEYSNDNNLGSRDFPFF
jgi:hypothetical protein